MAKWQKHLAIFAAGSIVTGILTIATGVMAEGVADIQKTYMAPEPEPIIITKEYDNISKLDLSLIETYATIEVADVKKVTVIETKREFVEDHSGRPMKTIPGELKASVENGTLHLKNEPNQPIEETPTVNTDILSIFRNLRRPNLDFSPPITIQIPKNLVLEALTVQTGQYAGLDINKQKIKQVGFTAKESSTIRFDDVIIDQIKGASTSAGFDITNSFIKKGELTAIGGHYNNIQQSRLENMTISMKDTSLSFFENQLKDSKLDINNSYHGATMELGGINFVGKVEINVRDNYLRLFETPQFKDITLNAQAKKGTISIDVEEVSRTYIDDEKESTYHQKGKKEKAIVTLSTNNADIEITDSSTMDGYVPEWAQDGTPDFTRFEKE